MLLLMLVVGCAKYNTFYNASRAFRQAEDERKERLKAGDDAIEPSAGQKRDYEDSIKKCQKILDEYTGSGLTDDALFLMAKSYHRLNSYRMSIRKFELLFANFPATPFHEEALFLQALNYMFIGDMSGANELLELLNKHYPRSRFQAEALRSSGENSFVLEEWEAAATSFRQYLERYPESEDRDQIRYKLAQCLWESEEYDLAVRQLEDLLEKVESKELAFNARLLLVRTFYQLGRHDEATRLLEILRSEAGVYRAEGDVALAEAENLMVQGRYEEATPILENMPEEWRTQGVGPRLHNLLGRIYFRNWQLEEARKEFQDALRGSAFLEKADQTRSLAAILQDYLAAEQGLVDARPEDVPRLKLLQANALLFGMQRPRLALDSYLEIAGDAAVDSITGARSLYGATHICRDYLALPDSAELFSTRLMTTYPQSPQAFLVRTGGEGDLLAFLMDLQREDQARLSAAESDTAQAAGQPAASPLAAQAEIEAAAAAQDAEEAVADTLPPAFAGAPGDLPAAPAQADTMPAAEQGSPEAPPVVPLGVTPSAPDSAAAPTVSPGAFPDSAGAWTAPPEAFPDSVAATAPVEPAAAGIDSLSEGNAP
jgi:TolA-binding protein